MRFRWLSLAGAALLLAACTLPPAPTAVPTRTPDAWVMSFNAARTAWDADRARLERALGACPAPQQPLGFSSADALRDGIRQRPQPSTGATTSDPAVLAARQHSNERVVDAIQALALADWRIRRAAANQDPGTCQAARSALTDADAAMADAQSLASGAPTPSPASAPAPGPDAVRIAVRTDSIEALPLALAQRTGLLDRAGLRVTLVDAGSGNPLDVPGVQAAVGTQTDLLSAGTDYADAFAFYARPPVGLAVVPAMAGQDLSRLVVSAPVGDRSLAALIARSHTGSGGPRLVSDGGWFPALVSFSVGQVDGVLDAAPLPQYLAAGASLAWDASADPAEPSVGAGSLLVRPGLAPATRDRLIGVFRDASAAIASTPAEDLADLVAPDFPLWEPDAVLEMVRVAKRCLNPGGQLSPAAAERARQLLTQAG